MNRSTAQVLRGFHSLSDSEKSEFVSEVNEWYRGDQLERRSLEASANKVLRVDLGPTSSNYCTCCGR